MLVQFIASAFSLGSFYALVALGFSLIFGVTRAFNLAHGELIVLAGYLSYLLAKQFGVPILLTLPASMLCMLGVTILLNYLLRYVREPFQLNSLVLTFGLALVLQNIMLALFSADYRLVHPVPVHAGAAWLDFILSNTQAAMIFFSLLATTLVYLLWRKTYLGKALRATMQDREAARLAGIRVDRMCLTAFAVGGLLIGLAGPLYALNSYLHPFGGMEATLIAVIITIFAGIGRIRGIVVGGWILAFVESAAVFGLGASWRELVSASILIGLLVLRPEGILPFPSRVRR